MRIGPVVDSKGSSVHRERVVHGSVYISTGAFRTLSISEIIRQSLEAGLYHVELSSGTDWEPDMLDLVHQTAGSPIHYLVHNYFPPHEDPFVLNLASADPGNLERSLDHCRRAVDLSADLKGAFFSVHSGFAFTARPEHLGKDQTALPRVSLEQAQEIFVQSLKTLCAYASERGVTILIENNVIAPFNLINGKNRLGLCATAEELLQTHAGVGASNLGFLIDVGHAKVTATALRFDAQAFLDKVAPYVRAFHLSDNDGTADTNQCFDESAWFIPRLADFPETTMILESYRLEIGEIRRVRRVIEDARSRKKSV